MAARDAGMEAVVGPSSDPEADVSSLSSRDNNSDLPNVTNEDEAGSPPNFVDQSLTGLPSNGNTNSGMSNGNNTFDENVNPVPGGPREEDDRETDQQRGEERSEDGDESFFNSLKYIAKPIREWALNWTYILDHLQSINTMYEMLYWQLYISDRMGKDSKHFYLVN